MPLLFGHAFLSQIIASIPEIIKNHKDDIVVQLFTAAILFLGFKCRRIIWKIFLFLIKRFRKRINGEYKIRQKVEELLVIFNGANKKKSAKRKDDLLRDIDVLVSSIEQINDELESLNVSKKKDIQEVIRETNQFKEGKMYKKYEKINEIWENAQISGPWESALDQKNFEQACEDLSNDIINHLNELSKYFSEKC